MPTYTISVNGEQRSVEASADMPLLWVLRDLLGLTGTKFGCGIGQCRACTVHVDGAPTFSCRFSVAAAEGREIFVVANNKAEGSAPLSVFELARQIAALTSSDDR